MTTNDPPPRPLDLWDFPCNVLDTLLMLVFDPRELANLAGVPGVGEGGRDALPESQIYIEVHRQCHEDTPLARRLQHHLESRFATFREAFVRCEAGDVLDVVRRYLNQFDPGRAAGVLWACARDPREPLRLAEQGVVHRVRAASHKALQRELADPFGVSSPTTA